MSANDENVTTDSLSVASRKIAAAELRRARKAARDRLLSDTSDEIPKGILKNARQIPTKRSVSECVDDLSHVMAHLNVDINDLPKATGKFCPHHHHRLHLNNNQHSESHECFDEEDEEDDENHEGETEDSEEGNVGGEVSEKENSRNRNLDRKECDCNINKYGDYDENDKPKKSVRFNDHVYETVFFASRLYDRRYFAKYHFSSRHHPPANNGGNNKSKKNKNSNSSKSESKDEQSKNTANSKTDNSNKCKLTKSQRARQSKKDKKKRLNKREETIDTSSDDQGYCSSMHSFSD